MAPKLRNVAVRRSTSAAAKARALTHVACVLGLAVASAGSTNATELALHLPDGTTTHADGRMPLPELFATYLRLGEKGWQLDLVAESKPRGAATALPIVALRSPRPGAAVWILAGIHGEEPAGPNAVAAAIDDLAALGEKLPVVLLPLCNPHGYARNWRYLDMPTFSETQEGSSVGDSSHLLPSSGEPSRPRAAAAPSPEADALTRYIVTTSSSYPPLISIDLHEDDLVSAGYVYSQGELGTADPLALQAVAVLREHGIAVQLSGQTRFGETIVGGIIGPVRDSSIDELMSAKQVVLDGRSQAGPAARTVLVFETPAKDLPIDRRVAAHLSLLRRLAELIAAQQQVSP